MYIPQNKIILQVIIILGTFGIPGHNGKNNWKKIKYVSKIAFEILQRYCKLVWVLWAYLAKPIKKYSVNLQKTFDVHQYAKNQLHHSLLS